MNANEYKTYREDCTRKGEEYQDFICKKLAEKGIYFTNYSTKSEQYNIGENDLGLEIKYDDKIYRYCPTGRLYIETSEKAEPRAGGYAPSGIYRDDNSWLFGIGNYDIFFIFEKKELQKIDTENPHYLFRPKTKETSTAFCLPLEYARKLARHVFVFEQEVAELTQKTTRD